MSSITTDQGIVHYEVYGRGRPVILLHGYLGSWGLWQDTMAYLGRYYRTYALDFWGFGESDTKQTETYVVQDFVKMVGQFMDQLGIIKAPLVGHSMGGTVSLLSAINYPERVQKVVVIGSPITGSSLSVLLKLFGMRPIGWVVYHNLWAFKLSYRLLAPFYSSDKTWFQMMDRDVSRTKLEAFFLSIGSLRRTDVRPRLGEIKVPVMGMYGPKDIIVHPQQWKPLQAGIPHAKIEIFPKAGHFIMLDDPQSFKDKLRSFLDETPQTSVSAGVSATTPIKVVTL
ncbi:MAG: alpha/beta fold hydrolase [Chloroflexota bacterium]